MCFLRNDEKEETKSLLNNHEHPHALPKRGTTIIEFDNKDETEKDADEHPIKFCFSFVGSRILIFLMLMLKWTLMVFSAACALSIVATSIFLSISIIYRLIKMSCQCELNEGNRHVFLATLDSKNLVLRFRSINCDHIITHFNFTRYTML